VRVPEGLAAVAAEEHLPGVAEHVPLQQALVGEPELAVGARERLLTTVDAQVVLEVPWEEHNSSIQWLFSILEGCLCIKGTQLGLD